MTTALEGGEGSAERPGRSLPPGKTRYPLYRRLGGPTASLDRCGKSRPPPGFDPCTIQPVASRYTDYATREGQIPLAKYRRRRDDNIKTYLHEVGWWDKDWIDMAQDRNAVMNLWIP